MFLFKCSQNEITMPGQLEDDKTFIPEKLYYFAHVIFQNILFAVLYYLANLELQKLGKTIKMSKLEKIYLKCLLYIFQITIK